jgi:hypothetical protein
MPSSFLADNLRNLLRNLQQDGLSAIPGRLATIAKRKSVRLFEEVAYGTPVGNALGRAYRGAGIVLMFHEIHADVDAELRTGCDAAQLERIILALRAANREIVLTTIDLFGTQRCMFASNFPVDSLCASFATIFDGFRDIVAGLSASEERALFRDNALRLYAIS